MFKKILDKIFGKNHKTEENTPKFKNKAKLKQGGYAIAITAIVVAVAVAFNILFAVFLDQRQQGLGESGVLLLDEFIQSERGFCTGHRRTRCSHALLLHFHDATHLIAVPTSVPVDPTVSFLLIGVHIVLVYVACHILEQHF